MPFDALLNLLALGTTETATFTTPGVDARQGTTPRPLFMYFTYSAASDTSGANTITFEVDHSDDSTTWYLHTSGQDKALALSSTAQQGQIILPILTAKRYVRGQGVFSGAGAAPTIKVGVRIGIARPG
jgi:hypothetical protein